ncbi:MAG: O-antigen ligase family protein, partial [Acidobacteria bacterium]|nr:O-antigen ligase family protein [Acidobacteriota bacterium]
MSSHHSAIPVTETIHKTVENSAILARPELRWSLGFVAMLLYLIVEYMRLSAQYPIFQAVQIGKVVVLLGLLGWLLAPRIPAERGLILHVDAGLMALFFAAFISAIFARDQESAWASVSFLGRWLFIYFLIGRIVASSWRLRIFVFLLLLLNLKMAQAGIRGFFDKREFGQSDELLAKIGVGAGSVGFFSNAGDFGVAMSVVWPLAGILILAEKKWLWRGVLAACFAGISGAILVCGSRGAVVAALVTALVALVRNPRRIGVVLLFLLFVPAVVYLLPEASKARMRSGMDYKQDKTASHRLALWKAGLEMFRDNPLVGVGPGNFAYNYSIKYSNPDQDP